MAPEPVFPIIAFLTPHRPKGWPITERFVQIGGRSALEQLREGPLKHRDWVGARLVDNTGQAFVIREVKSIGFRTPLWLRLIMRLTRQGDDVEHAVVCRLEPQGPVPFAEVQDRVCRCIDLNSDDWIDDEAMAGEAGEPLELDDVLAAAKAAVRRATDVATLFDGLDAAWPY